MSELNKISSINKRSNQRYFIKNLTDPTINDLVKGATWCAQFWSSGFLSLEENCWQKISGYLLAAGAKWYSVVYGCICVDG